MEYLIRDMKEEDWDAVSSIYKQSLLEGKSTFQIECPSYETWSKNHLQDCRYVIVADGSIAGWCAISATSVREVYKGVVEISIYFDKASRGKGLGTKLLKYLIEKSEEKGYWCLYAAIFSINEASIKLHEKCGFRVIGYREKIAKDRFGEWQNTTLMERRSRLI